MSYSFDRLVVCMTVNYVDNSSFSVYSALQCMLISDWSVQEELEETKGVIRIRISKKNRQHNGQKKKYKRTNNDLQNIHIKLKIE